MNTAENPKEAEALAYGDLFYIQCPKCGYQTMANYSLLYHDVEHGMMIQYIGDAGPRGARERDGGVQQGQEGIH